MGEPIRIAQILNRMDSGGIEAIVTEYYRHINRDQIQFDFYYADDSSIRQKDELQRMGAGTYAIPDYSKPLRFHQALYKAFKMHHYTIVHVHLNSMSVFALFAAWRAGIPVRICHNHSTAHLSEGKVTWLKYFLRPFNLMFANRYFACGNVAAEWMYGKKRVNEGKVTVIPNAIDIEKYKYDPHARTQLRRELGINDQTFVVGHVGRFKHQKNHRFLLKIFHALLCEKPDAVLLLIGEGQKIDEIRALSESMGIAEHVIFAGVRQDMDKLYSAMDVFCLPSYYEGMPLVAWEAQCNGLPCILADTITQEAKQKDNVEFVTLSAADALGLIWTILNPLMMMTVITLVFSTMFKSNIPNFPIYYLAGSLIFSFNSEATTTALNSIISNASLIKKVYIPKYLFPLSNILSGLVNLFFSLIAMIIVMIILRVPFRATMLLIPIPIFYVFLFATGLGLALSALTVYFRDIAHFYSVFVLAWTYATPIFYPVDLLGDVAMQLMQLNPMYHFVSFMRELVLYGTFPSVEENLICLLIGCVSMVIGLVVFYKKQDKFVLYV